MKFRFLHASINPSTPTLAIRATGETVRTIAQPTATPKSLAHDEVSPKT